MQLFNRIICYTYITFIKNKKQIMIKKGNQKTYEVKINGQIVPTVAFAARVLGVFTSSLQRSIKLNGYNLTKMFGDNLVEIRIKTENEISLVDSDNKSQKIIKKS